MSQKTLFTKSALAVAVALISTQAWSAGFQLNEFSSSGLGRAYSGEGAIADDAGNVSRNPALITMFDRPTFSAGAVYIDPDVNISGTSPSGRSLKADNIAPTAWVRTCTLLHRLTTNLVGALLLPLTMVWQQSLMILMQAALSGVQLTLKP
ncbi:long-chain fatty acid transport protein [Escherichia coli]|uniref:Long-chain fatty acid transport protein n=1 Tax=Escherichia coli TaxID=562 RepID=A0A376TV61_ECOLX|nr:long-chain fatty acid transport protein [Escherichia coli]